MLKPIEGTILTVVRETGRRRTARSIVWFVAVGNAGAAREAGRVALANTPEQLPVLKDAGVVDAGGAGFLLLMDSALHVVDGEPLPEPSVVSGPTGEQLEAVAHRAGHDGAVDVSELRCEVMFLLNLDDVNKTAFMEAWGEIDSIVVVGGDGLYNCHVHTNDIGAAIEAPLKLDGKPFNIRVTDLFEEVDENTPSVRPNWELPPRRSTRPCRLYPRSGAAVSSGSGLDELFSQVLACTA